MSRRLVIPAGDTPTSFAPHGKGDRTWQEIAVENNIEDGIEVFGSAWCVENAIDGLGICTEDSGQESPAQIAARVAAEAAAALEAMVRSEKEAAVLATADRLDALVAKLETKAILTKADADEVKGTAAISDPVTVKEV